MQRHLFTKEKMTTKGMAKRSRSESWKKCAGSSYSIITGLPDSEMQLPCMTFAPWWQCSHLPRSPAAAVRRPCGLPGLPHTRVSSRPARFSEQGMCVGNWLQFCCKISLWPMFTSTAAWQIDRAAQLWQADLSALAVRSGMEVSSSQSNYDYQEE